MNLFLLAVLESYIDPHTAIYCRHAAIIRDVSPNTADWLMSLLCMPWNPGDATSLTET